jgi:hypothetical protein
MLQPDDIQFVEIDEMLEDLINGKINFIRQKLSKAYAEHVVRLLDDLSGTICPVSLTAFHRISLICPITLTRISEPVRFRFCTHLSCMDKTSWEHHRTSLGHFPRCPECQKKVDPTKDLIMDEILPEILASTKTQIEDHAYIRHRLGVFEWKLQGDIKFAGGTAESIVDLTNEPQGITEPVAKRKRRRLKVGRGR